MSGVELRGTVSAMALAAATAKTVLQLIAAAQHRVKVPWIEISFDGVSPTDQPVLVRVRRQTDAIGGSPTTVTLVKVNQGDNETIQTTAAKSAGGTEPSGSDIYCERYLHPQGSYILPGPFWIMGGDRLGIVCTAPAVVNVSVSVPCEE